MRNQIKLHTKFRLLAADGHFIPMEIMRKAAIGSAIGLYKSKIKAAEKLGIGRSSLYRYVDDPLVKAAESNIGLRLDIEKNVDLELAPLYPNARSQLTQQAQSAFSMNDEEFSLFDKDGEIVPLEELERRFIAIAADYYGGRMATIARMLKIGRSSLYRYMDVPVLADYMAQVRVTVNSVKSQNTLSQVQNDAGDERMAHTALMPANE